MALRLKEPEAFKHDFDGQCIGRPFETFSVGIFQWLPKSSRKGLKRSAAKVRVRGYMPEKEKVFKFAEELCEKLDEGWEPDKKYYNLL